MKKKLLHTVTLLAEQVLFVLLLLFIAGCTSQKVTSQIDSLPAKPKPDIAPQVTPEAKQPDLPLGPDTFDIGLVLPFYLDSVKRFVDEEDTLGPPYYGESKLAIEFYNGVKLALNTLTPAGFHARLHVYDDMNDKERIKKISELPVFKKLDLLLGPVYNNNLRAMSTYARRDSVFMVSPLSPATKITSLNPYYIMVNPTIEVHCKRLFDYVMQKHKRDNIILLIRPGSEVEDLYAAIFRKLLKQYQAQVNDTSLDFKEVLFKPKDETGDALTTIDETFTQFFDEYKKNVVIIPSVDKAYNHSAARKLYSLIEPPKELEDAVKYDITVLGLPAWGDQQDLRLDYAQKLNVHFTASSFIPSTFYSQDNAFYKTYVETFHTEPSEYAIKGYDLMQYFGNLLVKYGVPVDSMLVVERFNGIHTKFHFGVHELEVAQTPVDPIHGTPVAPVPVTDYIENKYVHLLMYQDGEVKPVD